MNPLSYLLLEKQNEILAAVEMIEEGKQLLNYRVSFRIDRLLKDFILKDGFEMG